MNENNNIIQKRSEKAKKENRKETINTIISLGLEGFKVFMSCLLLLFVSQKCGNHECSINEKIFEDFIYSKIVLFLNFITLVIFISVYSIVFYRERFIIKHFNDNNKYADDRIKHIIHFEPIIKQNLTLWNKRFYYGTITAIGFGIINFIISGQFIYAYHYNGAKSMTTIVTNILLVSNSLSSNLRISKKSFKNCLALSSTRLEPISYNEFDKFITRNNKDLQDFINKHKKDGIKDEINDEINHQIKQNNDTINSININNGDVNNIIVNTDSTIDDKKIDLII